MDYFDCLRLDAKYIKVKVDSDIVKLSSDNGEYFEFKTNIRNTPEISFEGLGCILLEETKKTIYYMFTVLLENGNVLAITCNDLNKELENLAVK